MRMVFSSRLVGGPTPSCDYETASNGSDKAETIGKCIETDEGGKQMHQLHSMATGVSRAIRRDSGTAEGIRERIT